MLPLRDIVVFPHMVVPLLVGREKSIRALDESVSSGREILLVAAEGFVGEFSVVEGSSWMRDVGDDCADASSSGRGM